MSLKVHFSKKPFVLKYFEAVCIKFTHVYWTCLPSSKIGNIAIWDSGVVTTTILKVRPRLNKD